MSKIKLLFYNFGMLCVAFAFLFYNSNPPDGKTGGPGEGTCGDCHSGGTFGGTVEIIGLPSTINSGQAYNITVRATNTSGNADKAGFQLMALNSSNNNAGDLIALSSDHGTNTSGGREYVEQRNGKLFDGSNMAEWTFQWVAPAGPNGTTITMYCDVNMVDGNGSTGGDKFFLKTASGTLMVNTTPVEVTVTSTNVSCNGGSDGTATANPSGGTAPYTYKWSNNKITQTITGLNTGTYKVTVTDKDGQTAMGQTTITQPPALAVSINGGVLTCSNPEVTLKATVGGGVPPYSYLWNTTETGSEISIDNPGTYSVIITDDNGCTKSASTTITENKTEPVVSIDPPGLISCAEPVIQLNSSVIPANCLLLWTTNDGKIVGGPNSLNPLVSKPGIYTLTATNPANGCITQEIVQVNGVIPLSSTSSFVNINCNGDSTGLITVSPTGGLPPYKFLWSNGEKTNSIDSLPAGIYTVTINDNSTCHDTLTIEITQPSKLVVIVNITDQSAPNQNDGTATVSPQGGSAPYEIVWSNGDTTNTIKQLSVGTYSVEVTDSLGCTVTESVFINPYNCGLSVVGELIEILCHNGNNGKICAAPIGGTSPYTYKWSNDSDQNCIENLIAGTYNLTVTDSIGCIHLEQFTLSQPEPINLPADSILVTGETGFNFSDGQALLAATGGTAPYLYKFANGGGDGKNLSAGLNDVLITDANGCSSTFQFNIPAYPCDTLGIKGINLDIKNNCVGQPVTVDILSVLGGVGPYIYNWNNGTNKMSVTDLFANINSVTVTDSKNCASKFFTNIPHPDTITLEFTVQDATPGNFDGSIFVNVSGGVAPYTYLWSAEGKSGEFIDNLFPGNYCVTITDFNGCTVVECTEVKNKVGTSDLIASGWKLFPNPANEYVYLQRSIPDAAPVNWQIFNTSGENILNGEVQSANGLIPVYLGNQASGTYLIVIKHNNKNLISRFIIK